MKIEYISHMGDDDMVVDAARVSMDKVASKFSKEENIKLLKYLATHKHFTPFTHPQITVRETVPIFVARQRFKHTIGFSYNEISRRYVDDKPNMYVPTEWRQRPDGSIKQGSGGVHINNEHWNYRYSQWIEEASYLYNEMIKEGVAPEQARMVLPQSMYTSYYVTGSLAAWARAYKLRIDSHAQLEIQDLAVMWDAVLSPLFPESWKVLTGA